jgi:hypothetical protein
MELHDRTSAQNTRLDTAQRHLRRFLRRTAPVLLGAGLVAVFGLSLSGTLTGSHEDDHRVCTLATLKGRYLFASQGTLLPPAFSVTQPTPAAHSGFHLFNGDGTATEIVTFNIGGFTALDNVVIPFQYSVNANCTGSYSLPSVGLSVDLFIAPDGAEFASIPTAPLGGVLTTIDRRVSRK